VTDWDICYRKPLPHLHKGKSVLIGDAAHSMFPTTGQGGCQALEDVACLSILLSSLPLKSALTKRLELYSSIRKTRVRTVQWLSPLRPGQEEELRLRDPRHPIHRTSIKTGKEHVEFLYQWVDSVLFRFVALLMCWSRYDIFEETRKALQKDERLRPALL
jgi:salicylate hydroxylase